MAKFASTLFQSRAVRSLIETLEEKLPPLRAWHRFEYEQHFARETPKARMFAGVYDSFEAAEKAITAGTRKGHDHPEVADRHASEINHIWPSDYPVLFWLSGLLKADGTVFDLGGNVGISFHSFRKYLNYPGGLTWRICEVAATVNRGRELAEQMHTQGLYFTTEVEEMADADVLLASGSIQFLEVPLWRSLSRVLSKPRHILINRAALNDGPSFATLHNFGPASCVYRIYDRTAFIAAFEALGYLLVDSWDNPEFSCVIPFHPAHTIKSYSGMYFRLDQTKSATRG
ncbi:MAG: TIGR04325 family methyltransferase [Candidatus Binataceae bacterium]